MPNPRNLLLPAALILLAYGFWSSADLTRIARRHRGVPVRAEVPAAAVEAVRKVLKKLKEKERGLREKLDEATEPEERKAIAAKLAIIYAQRRKGLGRVRAIRKGAEQTRDGD